MESSEIYLSLYKIKVGLQKQLADLEIALEKCQPSNRYEFDRLTNNIIIGKYDYPENGLYTDKIIFVLEKLKRAKLEDIIKYIKILDKNISITTSLSIIIEQTLKELVTTKFILEMQENNVENLIEYELNTFLN